MSSECDTVVVRPKFLLLSAALMSFSKAVGVQRKNALCGITRHTAHSKHMCDGHTVAEFHGSSGTRDLHSAGVSRDDAKSPSS